MVDAFPVCRNPTCRTIRTAGYADRGLCLYHETVGREAITRLADDWVRLQPFIWQKPRLGDSVFTPFGPTLPFDTGVEALTREIVYTAQVWELPVREKVRLSDAPNQHSMGSYEDLLRAARILDAHYLVLAALGPHDHISYNRQPTTADGVDAILHLTTLHNRARARVGSSSSSHSVQGCCGVCGRETLRHDERDVDYVYCAMCGATWTWDEYADAVDGIPAAA